MYEPKPFDLPTRTRARLRASVPLSKEQGLELLSGQGGVAFDRIPLEQYGEFTCIDCGFSTEAVEEMFQHQGRQAQYHTLCQRVRRSWQLWRAVGIFDF